MCVCLCVCVCASVKDSLPCTLVLHKPDVVYHCLHCDRASLTPNKSFSPPLFDCWWILSFSCFVLLSGYEITICLIVGDAHTPQQLGCAQIICYTTPPPHPLFFSLPLFISQPFFLSFSPFSSFSPPPSCLLVEVVIHQTATSVRCQLALINDSDARMLNERGKWESWVIIRKALFSAYRCLLFILHRGWGQNALIGELNKLRKQVCSLNRAGLRLKCGFVSSGEPCYSFFFFFKFLFCPQSGEGLFSVLMLPLKQVQTVSSTSSPFPIYFPFSHFLLLSYVPPGCPAVWWRQPEESAREGEVGSVSHATFHPSRLSEPSPWHDWSGCLQKTNGQFS